MAGHGTGGYSRSVKTPFKLTAFLLIAAAVVVAFTTSCSTARGFGRDVETLGGNIEESAR